MLIDGQSCVEDNNNHPETDSLCTRQFANNGSHTFEIVYFEGYVDGSVEFYVAKHPGGRRTFVFAFCFVVLFKQYNAFLNSFP